MKVGARIYVIYFLIRFKMKKIVFLFFTFSGICPAFAQKPVELHASDSLKKERQKNDSSQGKELTFIRLFPNPARNKVEIEIKGFEPGFVQVKLIDNTGNTVRDDRRLLFKGNEIIVAMFSLQPGIYFLMVEQNKKRARSKLIIQ